MVARWNMTSTTPILHRPRDYCSDVPACRNFSCAILEVRCILRLTVAGHGEALLDPVAADYPLGAEIQVLGLPADDAFFVGWTGDLVTTENPTVIRMVGNRDVTVVFGSRRLTLEVDGVGSVVPDPARELYDPGDAVLLTALQIGRAHV